MATAGGAMASERDERPGSADEQYALSAAQQGGRFAAWRLDRTDGRVSVCLRQGTEGLSCSRWSAPGAPGTSGPYAINAENSGPVGTLWVWRIDTASGRLDYCSVGCCSDFTAREPTCLQGGP